MLAYLNLCQMPILYMLLKTLPCLNLHVLMCYMYSRATILCKLFKVSTIEYNGTSEDAAPFVAIIETEFMKRIC